MLPDRERETQEIQEAGRGEGGGEAEDQRQGEVQVNCGYGNQQVLSVQHWKTAHWGWGGRWGWRLYIWTKTEARR